MAEKACHGFGSTTQVGLTQALDVMPKIPELLPLLNKANEMHGSSDAKDVLSFIVIRIEKASTPSMAVSLCNSVKGMTHVKAWGDLNIHDFGNTWTDWLNYMSDLGQVAQECARQIERRYG